MTGITAPTRAQRDDEADGLPRGDRVRVAAIGVVVGFVVAVVWSYEFVDQTIGGTVADTLLGYDAEEAAITGSAAGAVFAFVSGLAATFTACNVAAFSAVAPLLGEERSVRRQLAASVRPLGWLALGMLVVSGVYGAAGAVLGELLPQLSAEQTAAGMPVRLVQSSVVFGVIGLAFAWLGLAALGVVPDVLAGVKRRFPHAQLVVVGGLIGGFLIGRPFGLFHRMFTYAAERSDPLYGAATFMLQSLGNIVVLAVLFCALLVASRGRLQRWLTRRPGRLARVTGGAFVTAGSFTVIYWVWRVPSAFGYGWFPTLPWH